MTTHKPNPTEEHLQQIQETLEQMPDRDDLENWSDSLAFKLEKLHEDVMDLRGELAQVKDQNDDLQSELAEVKGQVEDLQSEDR